ncbi:MAG: peptidoglycan-binding protein [Sphingomonas fennica]
MYRHHSDTGGPDDVDQARSRSRRHQPGVRAARQRTMLSLLGNPRENYTSKCQPVTDRAIAKLIVYEDVGPFSIRGLKPAVASLRTILQTIGTSEPEVYDALGNEGMLCARLVRGSTTAISNHSWGTAIDLTLEGVLDRRGDGKVQIGLTRIYRHFNAAGWFCGAAFGTEDAMHFEAGDALIRQWHGDGTFATATATEAVDAALSLGDRGPDVADLQRLLNRRMDGTLAVDGDFGLATHAAVLSFQAAHGLYPDGIVGPRTLAKLEAED